MRISNPSGSGLTPTQEAELASRGSILKNVDAANMKPWRDAVVKTQRGTDFTRVLCIGTSSTFGVGPSSESHQWVRVFAETLRARLGYGEQCMEPFNSATVASRSYISAGSGWTTDAGGSIGDLGNIQGAAGAAGELTFTHPHCDRFTVWYTSGNFSMQIDSESATSGITGSVGVFNTHTIVSSNGVGQHTLKIKSPVGVTARPYLVEAHVGTGGIRVANFGVSGSTAADFDNQVEFYDGLPLINVLDPDLVIFQVGGNDVTQEVPVATYKSRLKAAAQYVWDNTPATIVMLELIEEHGNEIDSTYGEAVREIAEEIGCMHFSVTDAMLGDPAAYVDPNNDHFNNDGHLLWARSLAAALSEL